MKVLVRRSMRIGLVFVDKREGSRITDSVLNFGGGYVRIVGLYRWSTGRREIGESNYLIQVYSSPNIIELILLF